MSRTRPAMQEKKIYIKVSVWEGGDVETDDIFVVRRAIGEWDRAAPEDRNKAIVSSSKQALQIFLGLGGFRIIKERVYYFCIKGGQSVRVSQDR